MVAWNGGAVADTDNNNSGHDGGFIFNNNPSSFLGQSQYLSSQRGPLQSSNNNNPSIRAWIDASSSMLAADNHHQHYQGIGFVFGGFSGFRVPARIQGQEEENDGVSNKPSSDSRHLT